MECHRLLASWKKNKKKIKSINRHKNQTHTHTHSWNKQAPYISIWIERQILEISQNVSNKVCRDPVFGWVYIHINVSMHTLYEWVLQFEPIEYLHITVVICFNSIDSMKQPAANHHCHSYFNPVQLPPSHITKYFIDFVHTYSKNTPCTLYNVQHFDWSIFCD